jgi:hypothetical protein
VDGFNPAEHQGSNKGRVFFSRDSHVYYFYWISSPPSFVGNMAGSVKVLVAQQGVRESTRISVVVVSSEGR